MTAINILTSTNEVRSAFYALVEQWHQENRYTSSTHQMVLHSAYQQIIGLGEPVVPLLLEELEKKTGRWFWALKAITRQYPVPPEHQGRTKLMIQAWLDWGEQHGYR
ncbi:MAG: hypothetical protein AAGG51_04630 [Cyanobacteria bacterium P01_G01_bin.54]